MAEIIPAILTSHFGVLQQQVRAAEQFAPMLHIDITDGAFVESQSIAIRDLRNVAPSIPFELHCMVKRPEELLDDAIASGAKRVILHRHSTTEELMKLLAHLRSRNCEAAVAVSAESLSDDLAPLLSVLSQVTYLAVKPGFQGGALIPGVLVKAKAFHEQYPDLPLEIDGGIKASNIHEAMHTNAHRYVVGSGIWESKDPAAAYRQLAEMVQ